MPQILAPAKPIHIYACIYARTYARTYAHIYAPIYAALRKDKDIMWCQKHKGEKESINPNTSDLLFRKTRSHGLSNSCNLERVRVSMIIHQ